VDTLQYIVREAGKQTGLAVDAHPHMPRYAARYMLANDGTDTRLIQAFLGHRHPAHGTLRGDCAETAGRRARTLGASESNGFRMSFRP
jgi:integrase